MHTWRYHYQYVQRANAHLVVSQYIQRANAHLRVSLPIYPESQCASGGIITNISREPISRVREPMHIWWYHYQYIQRANALLESVLQ